MTEHDHDHDHGPAPELDLAPMAELTRPKSEDTSEILLLRAWMTWWATNDEVSAKPDGLHVKTALFLTKYDNVHAAATPTPPLQDG